ncbi:hypothetical protein [Brevibacillus choshinensis]|nr:hypothetical protein [Brevibacillus choshinensis]
MLLWSCLETLDPAFFSVKLDLATAVQIRDYLNEQMEIIPPESSMNH